MAPGIAQKAGGDDVQITVTVDVCAARAVSAVDGPDLVAEEGAIGPPVFEPGDAVVRFDERGVVDVAVGKEGVEIAIVIEVDHLEPTAPEGGIGCGEKRSFGELPGAVVQERDDGLELLGDERYEVRSAVAIQVDDGDVARAVAGVEGDADEFGGAVGGPLLFQQEDLAGGVPAEDGDDEVEVGVAVEVGGLNVAHTSQAREDDAGLVGAVLLSLEPEYAAPAFVGRHRNAEIGDQEIADSVAVEVSDFGVGRMSQIRGEHGRGLVMAAGPLETELVIGGLAGDKRACTKDAAWRNRKGGASAG